MFDNNIAVKIALVFPAAVFWALFLFAGRQRGPNLSVRGPDTWSMEKFGIWWIGRALFFLVIVALGVADAFGLVFGGKGSFGGAMVLFWFSGAHALVGFLRGKI